jgi:hypothetical protein
MEERGFYIQAEIEIVVQELKMGLLPVAFCAKNKLLAYVR